MRVRSLYLNIYITVVTVLLLFALVAGLLVRHHSEGVRERIDAAVAARNQMVGRLLGKSLPPPEAEGQLLRRTLQERADSMQQELALEDAQGVRLAESRGFAAERREPGPPVTRVPLADGRVLLISRPHLAWDHDARASAEGRLASEHGPGSHPALSRPPPHSPFGGWARRWLDEGLMLLAVLFAAIAAGSYPVVRRLTRRLETLRKGVETFGAGALDFRVPVQGGDEVSAVAASFNRAAQRIEDLVRANRSLLANASHELRSPLARLKMAVSMIDAADGEARAGLRLEIDRDISELDALVEEVLLASRLDAQNGVSHDPVDVPAVVAEEAMRLDAELDVAPPAVAARVSGDERLLRRAVRNLLENARRYGGDEVRAEVLVADGEVVVRVCDRGPGVPPAERERIFEPFYRLPGHSEMAGGVGLGLALVRQIAQRHGGRVQCEPREGGGSCFSLSVPQAGA